MSKQDMEKVAKVLREQFPHGHPDFIRISMENMDLHDRKNNDYAGGGDPLGNFKREAAIFGLYPGLDMSDPVVVGMMLAMKQFDAALWLLSTRREGQVEDLGQRLADVANYATLSRILWTEKVTNATE